MTDSTGPSRPDAVPPQQQALVIWLIDLGHAAAALLRLAAAELQLAGSDLRRILVLGALMLPLAVFAWIGIAVWLSWVVYSLSGSAGAGLVTFPLIHVLILWFMQRQISRYRESLRLPRTRQHLKEISEVFQRE